MEGVWVTYYIDPHEGPQVMRVYETNLAAVCSIRSKDTETKVMFWKFNDSELFPNVVYRYLAGG